MIAGRFDPTRYPRTYKPWLPLRIAVGLLGTLVFAGGAGMFVSGLAQHVRHGSLADVSADLYALITGVAAYVVTMSLLRSRVRMTATSIELRTLWTTRRVLRGDIVDHELIGDNHRGNFRINASSLAQTMTSLMPLNGDADFRAWFAGLPESAMVETARNLQAVADDPRLGATPGARLAAAATARKATTHIARVVAALVAWAALYPHPRTPLLVLVAACPWLLALLCWRSKGLFSLAGNKRSGRGELVFAHLLAIGVLGWRAMTDVTLASGSTLLLWSLVATASMAVLLLAACPDLRRITSSRKLLHVTLLLAYALSVLDLANREFDAGPGAAQLVTVVARHARRGKSTTRYLTLAPTPADMASPDIEVNSDFYQHTRVGDPLCLRDHDGALGWHWIEVNGASACPFRARTSGDVSLPDEATSAAAR